MMLQFKLLKDVFDEHESCKFPHAKSSTAIFPHWDELRRTSPAARYNAHKNEGARQDVVNC